MKVQLFLLADYANVSNDGKLNIMGVFQTINAVTFPALHPSMYLILSMVAELGESGQTRDITIKMMDADGQEQFVVTAKAELPDDTGLNMPEVNTIIQLRDVPFLKPGRHMFVLIVDKDHKAQLSLQVNQVHQG